MTFLRYLPRFKQAYATLDQLAQRENWSRTEIDDFQLERINAVWRHAATNVPHYIALSAKLPLPPRFSTLDEFRALVPVLSKASVREMPERFLSQIASTGAWRRTGGSTGRPMSVYWSHDAHRESLRTKYRYYAAWGLDPLHRTAFLWGHSGSFAPGMTGRLARVRIPLEDLLRKRLRMSAYRLGRAELRAYLARAASFRPESFYGYSKALDMLAAEAELIGYQCDSVKLFTLTGEPVLTQCVERIERVFGVPATVEYGSTECGVMAMEQPDRTLRVREDVVMLETLRRDDGRYELVATVLGNSSFPLLRYAVGDVTDAPLTLPEHGFAILKNVSGRDNDFLVTPSGEFLHCSRFDALFKYHSPAIRGFQIRQRRDGSIDVQLEIDGPTQDLRLPQLCASLRDVMEGHAVHLELVDNIPQTSAGKHRHVMSCIAAPCADRPGESASGLTGDHRRTSELQASPRQANVATLKHLVRKVVGKLDGLKHKLVGRRLGWGRRHEAASWNRSYESGAWDFMRSTAESERYQLLAAYCACQPNATVLDVACGEGILLDHFSHIGFTPGRYLGLDIAYAAIAKARALHPGIRFVQADVEMYEPTESFDRIVLNECLYYFRRPLKVLRKLEAALAPSGAFVVSAYHPTDAAHRHQRFWENLTHNYESVEQRTINSERNITWNMGVFRPQR